MKTDVYFIEFLKDDGKTVGGGGIGTLISYLLPVLAEMGHEVTVYQCAGHPFDITWESCRVIGVPGYPGPGSPNERVVHRLRDLAFSKSPFHDRIEIFAGDFFSIKNKNPRAICVQNGLAWDADIRMLTNNKIYHNVWGEKIFRYRCQMRGLRRFETCHNRVAVDLYFLNWYRSFRGPNFCGRVFYNPNPAPEAAWSFGREEESKSGKPLKIIFARRLVSEKGTRLMAEVFKQLLKVRPTLRMTIAGEGLDAGFLKKVFSGENRVTITSYNPRDALKVHIDHDIAVIPSQCGEATCLSVLEAMAAGCAVVATNMGGTITQIIDNFNGLLCWPDRESLFEALLRLIDSPEERLRMQRTGWETSQTAFSLQRWQERWKRIISSVTG